MIGRSPAALAPPDRGVVASALQPANDAIAVLLIWAGSAGLSLFVAPRPNGASAYELLYYSVYNVAVGALIGLYLFDRVPKDGLALFVLRGCSALLCGTLVNETVVEPIAFESGPINGQGFYYGLTDALSTAGMFLFLRLAERLQALQQRVNSEGGSFGRASDDARCLFVRVGSETRRIHAPDVLYMEAERDFTRIVCVNGEHFVSESLKALVSKSAKLGLVRVHRSFAVNLGHVNRVTRSEIRIGDCRVPIGRRYWKAFAESWRA